jgi:hypothetical protein
MSRRATPACHSASIEVELPDAMQHISPQLRSIAQTHPPPAAYRTIPESSRNSTGAAPTPCSHMSEKNQTPLSPMQNSAGV